MIRKILINDVPKIKALIDAAAAKKEVLPRSLNNIYEKMRDFYVYEEDGKIYGCCALTVIWEDLGEIRSLIVDASRRGKGIGRNLVEACCKEAKDLNIKKVFLLTEKTEFFKKLGFEHIDKSLLPHKIWSDCVDCVQFPDCNELAMSKQI